MSVLKIAGAMASQWRWALMGLTVAAAIIFGWTVNDWRVRAAQAADLKILLRNEMQRRVAESVEKHRIDDARVALQVALGEANKKLSEKVKENVRRVVVRVPDLRECDLDDDVTGVLNRARAGLDPMPAAPDKPPGP